MNIDQEKLRFLVSEVRKVLEQEKATWRPLDASGKPGGVILLRTDIPTFIVPDLHGRQEFLPDLLSYVYQGRKVQSLLEQKQAQVVCVGDGMHGELRAAARWRVAYEEYQNDFVDCPAMTEEMEENFQTMAKIMELKIKYPQYFHFLKGNHENIFDENSNGNHSFAKFAAEGMMTRAFVEKFLGKDFLSIYGSFEKELPLLARGRDFVISHARPRQVYSLQNIINHRQYPEVVEGLTWTRDNLAETGAVKRMLEIVLGTGLGEKYWFAGHCPISGLYNFVERESLIQIHNPKYRPFVIVDPTFPFNPEKHILLVPKRRA
ncbi:MAG: hypothetical protein COB67_01670 [SAR324 cluster bacterium]|uniref:Serine/threonine specific protein phosphatases domain-containing protein n=1 Tax=SAR324 cluster bacterium TaxID=2024889 RepID=A0A2A4TC15_9DELT|nr:MAG: hypothetical protein COB67_01670 [SAR324 cluster bacterium]